ncbi:MAG: sugar dehydrogenase complex small subunit [Pseudomonadota bacterium]
MAWRLTRREALLCGAAWMLAGAIPTDTEVERFLELSRELTGEAELDPGLGRIYLQALRQSSLFAGQLEQAFADPGQAIPADLEVQILDQWFTGVVPTDSGPAVATYNGALMWRTMELRGAPGYCHGALGFWSRPPKS